MAREAHRNPFPFAIPRSYGCYRPSPPAPRRGRPARRPRRISCRALSDRPTLLLLGARGFVGRHLGRAAEDAGLRVLRASRDGAGADLACDLLRPETVRSALETSSPDAVANMAGASSVAASWRDPEETFAANVAGVENLLASTAAAAPTAHLLCVSSAQVYGEPARDRMPLGEDEPIDPVTPYGRSKAAMEAACAVLGARHGLRIAVVRPFNMTGPAQPAEYAVSGFARQAAIAERRGEESAELDVGNVEAARDFVDVRDAAGALAEIARRGLTGTFNLCSGRPVELREVIAIIGELSGRPVRVRRAPELARPADPSITYGSAARLREAIGWAPTTPLRDTIADVVEWWRRELG
jgi:GDP-4-dehydro-6-deoxy-D-mannose reductase